MERSRRERGPDLLTARNVFVALVILAVLVLILWLVMRLNQLNQQLEALEPEYFARNQVVLQGSRQDIRDVVRAVTETLEIDLTLVEFEQEEGIVPPSPPFLQPPQPPLQQEPLGRQFDPDQTDVVRASQVGGTFRLYTGPHLLQDEPDDVVTELYRIVSDQEVSVADVVNEIRNQAEGTTVTSDPNYVTGQRPLIIEGDPESGEGGAVAPGEPGAELIAFYNQWALDERGIALFNTDTTTPDRPDPALPTPATGKNIVVALFDTSPFDLQRLPVDFANTNVQHFEVVGIPDARDHGVFGASLVNVIAPDSEIRIYRVLNERNRGDLVTLLRALDELIMEQEAMHPRSDMPLLGTVINLSLSIHEDPDVELSGDNSEPIPTLYEKLHYAYSRGAVIVAASGNDSGELFRNGESPAAAQVPAAYDFVIGVGASNFNGRHSCFSNSGDVYAPGGDNDIADCMPVVDQCGIDEDHDACIIGYSVYISPETNYAYWLGTSFAAPLVSGQAALLLEAGQGRSVNPDDVMEAITSTVEPQTLGTTASSNGDSREAVSIVNIPGSLDMLLETLP